MALIYQGVFEYDIAAWYVQGTELSDMEKLKNCISREAIAHE